MPEIPRINPLQGGANLGRVRTQLPVDPSGQQLQRAGQLFSQTSSIIQGIQRERQQNSRMVQSDASSAILAKMSDRVNNPENGLLTTRQGRRAKGITEEFDKEWQDSFDKITKNLSREEQVDVGRSLERQRVSMRSATQRTEARETSAQIVDSNGVEIETKLGNAVKGADAESVFATENSSDYFKDNMDDTRPQFEAIAIQKGWDEKKLNSVMVARQKQLVNETALDWIERIQTGEITADDYRLFVSQNEGDIDPKLKGVLLAKVGKMEVAAAANDIKTDALRKTGEIASTTGLDPAQIIDNVIGSVNAEFGGTAAGEKAITELKRQSDILSDQFNSKQNVKVLDAVRLWSAQPTEKQKRTFELVFKEQNPALGSKFNAMMSSQSIKTSNVGLMFQLQTRLLAETPVGRENLIKQAQQWTIDGLLTADQFGQLERLMKSDVDAETDANLGPVLADLQARFKSKTKNVVDVDVGTLLKPFIGDAQRRLTASEFDRLSRVLTDYAIEKKVPREQLQKILDEALAPSDRADSIKLFQDRLFDMEKTIKESRLEKRGQVLDRFAKRSIAPRATVAELKNIASGKVTLEDVLKARKKLQIKPEEAVAVPTEARQREPATVVSDFELPTEDPIEPGTAVQDFGPATTEDKAVRTAAASELLGDIRVSAKVANPVKRRTEAEIRKLLDQGKK